MKKQKSRKNKSAGRQLGGREQKWGAGRTDEDVNSKRFYMAQLVYNEIISKEDERGISPQIYKSYNAIQFKVNTAGTKNMKAHAFIFHVNNK